MDCGRLSVNHKEDVFSEITSSLAKTLRYSARLAFLALLASLLK